LGEPNYQQQAQSLLSLGQTYGQMASGIASQLQQQQPMAAPPAPQSAFDGGIGQFIASQAARPIGPSPAMQGLTAMEAAYDPRSSAIEMLQNYQGQEAMPLSFYTPQSIESMGQPRSPKDDEMSDFDRFRQAISRDTGGTNDGGAGSMGGGQF
jgi:hypothetical protein